MGETNALLLRPAKVLARAAGGQNGRSRKLLLDRTSRSKYRPYLMDIAIGAFTAGGT